MEQRGKCQRQLEGDGQTYEWYLDVASGDVYRYGPPDPSVLTEWMKVDPHKIDAERLGRWERVSPGELGQTAR